MKLVNCWKCGLEPDVDKRTGWARCPVHDTGLWSDPISWNAAQFAARTERINAAAVAIGAGGGRIHHSWGYAVSAAEALIDAQDAATRLRWAEMQKGE